MWPSAVWNVAICIWNVAIYSMDSSVSRTWNPTANTFKHYKLVKKSRLSIWSVN